MLTYSSWNLSLTGEDLVTTNFESFNTNAAETYREGILGDIGVDGATFGGDWDAGRNPLDNPPGLYPRDDLANLAFYDNRFDLTFWLFPYFRVRSSTNGAAMAGKVSFSVQGSSQGPFLTPTGSVT